MVGPRGPRTIDTAMLDAVFLLAGTAFFVVMAAYAVGCDRL